MRSDLFFTKCLIAFVIFLFSTNFVFAKPQKLKGGKLTPEVKQFFDGVADFASSCAEKVWSGLDWSDLQVILVDQDQKQAWYFINSSHPKSYEIDYKKVPLKAKFADFDFSKNDSIDIYLAFDSQEVSETWEVMFHELFHARWQEGWKQTQTEFVSDRFTAYPILRKPRYYRHMIELRLREFLLTKDSKKLSQAKFWYDKYQNKFREEALTIAGTDQSEGTAEYFGIFASLYTALGCEDTKVNEWVERYAAMPVSVKSSVDNESYKIGFFASVILTATEPQWREKVRNGKTPLAVLFETMQSQKDKIDLKLKERIDKKIDQEENLIRGNINAFLEQEKSSQFLPVRLDLMKKQGSFSTMGFIKLSKKNNQKVMIDYSSLYTDSEGGEIRLNKHSAVEYNDNFGIVYLPRTLFENQIGKIKHWKNDTVEIKNLKWKKMFDDKQERVVID